MVQAFDFVLSPGGQAVPEDSHPTVEKITFVPDGYMLYNVSGIRAHIVSRLDGKGYDITKCTCLQCSGITCADKPPSGQWGLSRSRLAR